MIINKKFDYIAISRQEENGIRKYNTPDGNRLASVTTILSATKDMTHLNEWRARVGSAEATRIVTEAAKLGSGMHTNLENYILDKPMVGTFMDRALANVIIKHGLCNVDEVWGTEVALYSTELFAGTTDLVGCHNGIPTIIDFKNSLREKKREWIDDYAAQLAAYSLAHNEMYGTNIQRGVIMIATRDATYQEFVFEGREFDRGVNLWLEALDKYYKLPGSDN